jgi:hypothetical protein
MSQGLGRLEQHILSEIAKAHAPNPYTGTPGTVLLNSWTLARDLFQPGSYPGGWTPSQKHFHSVIRAMRGFVRKFPQYALTAGKGRKRLYLFQPNDPLSATWAKLSVERRDVVSRLEAEAAMRGETEG